MLRPDEGDLASKRDAVYPDAMVAREITPPD